MKEALSVTIACKNLQFIHLKKSHAKFAGIRKRWLGGPSQTGKAWTPQMVQVVVRTNGELSRDAPWDQNERLAKIDAPYLGHMVWGGREKYPALPD